MIVAPYLHQTVQQRPDWKKVTERLSSALHHFHTNPGFVPWEAVRRDLTDDTQWNLFSLTQVKLTLLLHIYPAAGVSLKMEQTGLSLRRSWPRSANGRLCRPPCQWSLYPPWRSRPPGCWPLTFPCDPLLSPSAVITTHGCQIPVLTFTRLALEGKVISWVPKRSLLL